MIIPGEKKKIEKAIQEAREERGPLSAKEKKQIAKRIHKREKRNFNRRAIILAVGLGAILGGNKLLEEAKSEAVFYEAEDGNTDNIERDIKTKNFKEQYKYDISIQETTQEPRNFEQEIKQMKTKEEVDSFLIDYWVENYESVTGDNTLTTGEINRIEKVNQTYVYEDQLTGQLITHGEKPEVTEQKLKEAGVSFGYKSDIDIYQVVGKDEKILDCAVLQDKQFVKVIPGEQYGKPYISIFEKMEDNIIARGIDFSECIIELDQFEKIKNKEMYELSIGIAQERFIEAVKESEITKENQNEKVEQQAEYGE